MLKKNNVIKLLVLCFVLCMVTAAQAAVYTVTKTADTDDGVCDAADCSLREAIATANLTADEDTIEFDPVLFASAQTINLSSDLHVLEGKLTINGPGAKLLTISGHSLIVGFPGGDMADLMLNRVTRSGGTVGIFNFSVLTVNDSTISNNHFVSTGGGIFNQGSLTVNNSTISNNSARFGGGIYNQSGGTVTVNNSTISNNSATEGGGGIQTRDGTLTVNNSTISGNTVSESFGNGGGIDCTTGSSTTVNNSTISGNSANQRGGGINNNGIALTLLNSTISKNSAPNGSGVFFSSIGVPTLRNTIIADNSSADLRTNGDSVNSLGYNLLGSFEEINGIADTDLVNQSARIAPLGYYGGQTMTHALLSNSLAINPASSNSAPAADQRGAARIGTADTGAFEVNNSANGGNFVAALPGGTQNSNYNFTLVPDNDSFTYLVTGGSLPNGVSLTTTPATDGVVALTGTPTESGTFNFSVTVSDGINSGIIDYTLEIAPSTNTAPTIIAASGITRQQAAVASNATIATVNDAEDAENTLSVAVTSANPVNGVTVSNLAVDAMGNVTANVSAACGATGAMFTLSVTDGGSLSSTAMLNVAVTNETTPPVIDPISNVTVYLPLNSTAVSRTVSFSLPTAMDNCTMNPTVTTDSASGAVFPVGTTTVNVTARDANNNQATASFTVTVLFNFAGFFQPVDNLPVVNLANAGQAIPVKFALSGNKGLNIFASGYPASAQIPCSSNDPSDAITETVNAGGSSLSYNATADQYSYVWKTDKAWRGTCRMLVVKFIDGSEHYAKFRFK